MSNETHPFLLHHICGQYIKTSKHMNRTWQSPSNSLHFWMDKLLIIRPKNGSFILRFVDEQH